MFIVADLVSLILIYNLYISMCEETFYQIWICKCSVPIAKKKGLILILRLGLALLSGILSSTTLIF